MTCTSRRTSGSSLDLELGRGWANRVRWSSRRKNSMSQAFTESVVEQAALAWLEALGYNVLSGPEIAPGEAAAERDDYGKDVLERRLRQALQRLNPQVPADALEEAFRKLTRPDSPSLVASNHIVHKYLVEGVPVEYQRKDGSIG